MFPLLFVELWSSSPRCGVFDNPSCLSKIRAAYIDHCQLSISIHLQNAIAILSANVANSFHIIGLHVFSFGITQFQAHLNETEFLFPIPTCSSWTLFLHVLLAPDSHLTKTRLLCLLQWKLILPIISLYGHQYI